MKKIIVIVSILKLLSSSVLLAANPGVTITTAGQSVTTDVSATDTLANTAIGVKVNSSIAGGAVTANVSAESTGTGLTYGVYLQTNSSMGSISGSISLKTGLNANIYGLLYGSTTSIDSVGLYNSTTKNSSSFNVDWTKIKLNLTNNNTATSNGAYGLNIIGTDMSSTNFGGQITTSAYGESDGIKLSNSKFGNISLNSSLNSSSSSLGSNTVYLISNSTLGNIDGKITASGSGVSSGIKLAGNSSIGNINSSSNINATSTNSAYALYMTDGSIVNLIDGTLKASITGTSAIQAYGIYNSKSTINSMSSGTVIIANSDSALTSSNSVGAIYATGSDSKTAVTSGISASINATSVGMTAFGINAMSNAQIGAINKSGAITVTSTTGTVFGLAKDSTATYGTISGNISIETGADKDMYGVYYGASLTGASLGLYNSPTYTSAGFNVDWANASFSVKNKNSGNYRTVALYVNSATSVGTSTGLGGLYTANSTAIGNTAGISANAGATIGNVLSTSRISATGVNGLVAGIYSNGASTTIGSIAGNVTSTTTGSGNAYGIFTDNEGSVGSISANVSAVSATGVAYGINTTNAVKNSFTLNNAIVSATSSSGTAYSLYSTNDMSISGTANFSAGDVNIAKALKITSGTFNFTSKKWNASSIITGTSTSNAVVFLHDNTNITATSIDIFAKKLDDSSYFEIDSGKTLTAGISKLNVYLSSDFNFVAGDKLTLFKGVPASIVLAQLGEVNVYKNNVKMSPDIAVWQQLSNGYGIMFCAIPESLYSSAILGLISLALIAIKRKK